MTGADVRFYLDPVCGLHDRRAGLGLWGCTAR